MISNKIRENSSRTIKNRYTSNKKRKYITKDANKITLKDLKKKKKVKV